MSLSWPGCLPVSRTIFALPSTVCAARAREMSRGRPARTPPSASASIMRNTYAGPLPDQAGHRAQQLLVHLRPGIHISTCL